MAAKPQISRRRSESQACIHLFDILLAALLTTAPLFAAGQPSASQVSGAPAASAAQHRSPHTNQHPSIAQAPVQPPAPVLVPEPPKPPDWPANNQPSQASVVWDSQGLRVDASNSSLRQILKDVSTATGATVDGLNSDQRIFGTYGPGPARDVLSQLLDGSGYNVVMVGDMGQGTPRKILLSSQPKGPAPPVPNNTAEDSADAADDQPQPQPQPPQQQPPAIRNGFSPGMPPRTPQQIMQEMQQRQQQIEQMQQQQLQQNNPPR